MYTNTAVVSLGSTSRFYCFAPACGQEQELARLTCAPSDLLKRYNVCVFFAAQVWDAHVFHYIVENGMTFLCMADEQSRRRIPFAFLEVCIAFPCGEHTISNQDQTWFLEKGNRYLVS